MMHPVQHLQRMRVNILYNVIKSRGPVMSFQCRRLLDSSILQPLPDFRGAMDCSLREVSRKEQSFAPKKAFFGPIRTKKRPKFLT